MPYGRVMRRAGFAVLLCALPAVYAACEPSTPGDGSADAGLQDVAAPDTSTPPGTDAASETATPPPDTGVDAGPRDASTDSNTADASADAGGDANTDSGTDAATDAGAMDAGADTAPPPLPVATTIDTDVDLYDANDTHVLYRKVPLGNALRYCESRACATPRQVGVSNYNAGKDYFAASTTKFYVFRDHQNFQASLHSFLPTTFPAVATQEQLVGAGWNGRIFVSAYSQTRSQISVTYTKTPILGAPTTAFGVTPIVTDQVPMTRGSHWNFGSDASLGTGSMAPTVTGATLPALATPAARIGTSARGATVPHPVAVILRDGNLEACPTAGNCAAWINLGPLGDTFNLDGTSLYVGGPTGLGKCALSEIATLGTCTLTPLVVGDPIASRVILTASQVWFITGGTLKFIPK